MTFLEKNTVRELAKRYIEIASSSVKHERRDLWRKHNSLQFTRPPVYVRAFAWNEMPESKLQCSDQICRELEMFFRQEIFRSSFDDDYIFEPWYTVSPVYKCRGWGVEYKRHYAGETDGLEAFKGDYFLKNLEDAKLLRTPFHSIDETATAQKLEQVVELIGDIITLEAFRGPAYRNFTGDISTDLGYLRGIENLMLDMYENPEWLHRLLKFMSDGILNAHNQAEAAGDLGLTFSYNQAMPYAEELPDPAAGTSRINRKQIWCFAAAQELTAVSPQMHEEFMLNYQLPIMDKFGLVAYGCCEDLTNKIDILRKIPNLRRIAVSPFANVKKCAEQIGTDYVISYRPSPSDMVSYGFDKDRIKKILRRDFQYMKNCCFDITLKDVETVEKDPERIRNWVKIVRQVIDEQF